MQTLETGVSPTWRRSTYWLILDRNLDRPEPLTVGAFPEEALAVFSFEEEALLFLAVRGLAGGWAAKEIYAIDLVSILLETPANHVALDPLPGPLGGKLVGLLSVSKERFLRDLVRKQRSVAARPFGGCGEKDLP